MGLNLTESAIDEFYFMIRSIHCELGHIGETLEKITDALYLIAKAQERNIDIKKGGEA